jgi:3-dehydroquinate dehydratase-1
MKSTVISPLRVRGLDYGGATPLFCIPLVPVDLASLEDQAAVAAQFQPDLIEWRADYFREANAESLVRAAGVLRRVAGDAAIIFTLRSGHEGGAQPHSQATRRQLIEAVLRTRTIDILDLELANEKSFLDELMPLALDCGARVLLAMHNFDETPANDVLLGHIRQMRARGADIAKVAVMPKTPHDVLRLLQVTAAARTEHPDLPLAMMSMGALGSVTRVAGFLYGSDMAFAVGKVASAPGQIPIEDARRSTELLLRYS